MDAGWGMGKSSLMGLVRAELKPREDVRTVWYNAWSATGADVLEGLIKTVLMKFDKRLLRRALHQLSQHGPLIRAALATLTVVASPFGLAGLVDRLWRELSVDPRARATMRDELKKLAEEWSKTTPGRPGQSCSSSSSTTSTGARRTPFSRSARRSRPTSTCRGSRS